MFKDKSKNKNAENQDLKKEEIKKKVSSEVEVISIPDKFRQKNKEDNSARLVGFVIIFFGFLLLVGAGFAGYWYFFRTPKVVVEDSGPVVEDNVDKNKEKENINKEEAKKEEPSKEEAVKNKVKKDNYKEIFLAFITDVKKANSYNDFVDVFYKYNSQKRIAEYEKDINGISDLTESFKTGVVSTIIKNIPNVDDLKSLEEKKKNDNLIILKTETVSEDKTIEVNMVYEDDDWKIDVLNIVDVPIVNNGNIFADDDNDGLSNQEELLLGTNKDVVDSDGDGYDDDSELLNLYNPAGEGKLKENTNISQFVNNTFSYKFLYPTAWSERSIGGEDSVMFMSSERHFIQIIVQPNPEKSSIDEWYKNQFGQGDIPQNELMDATTWTGIKKQGEFVLYLTDKDNNYIYTITYTTAQGEEPYYKNIFQLVINSLEIE